VRYVLLAVGVAVAVDTLGVNINAILAGSAALFVGIGLGLQNVTANIVAGIVLLVERPVKRGDFIQVGDTYGVVTEVGLRATRVVTRDEVSILIPNSELVSSQVVNATIPTAKLRLRVGVGVAYGSDTALVRRLLLQVAVDDDRVLETPEPEVRFADFGNSSLDFELLVWILDPRDDDWVASRLRFAIDATFREHGVEIPFPQRDLHVRSGLERLETGSGSR
jgi:small-conductance mechanosensitive channel